MQNIKKRVVIPLLISLIGIPAHAVVGPIIPGQNLWCVTQRIGETTDTILDKVMSLLDCPCTGTVNLSLPCAATPISNADAVAGVITIATPGDYCLSSDVTANIVVTLAAFTSGDSISLDLNDHTVNGVISLSTNAATANALLILKNGFIHPPTNLTGDPAGLTITVDGNGYVTVTDIIISPESAVGGNIGRNAVSATSTSVSTVRNYNSVVSFRRCIFNGGPSSGSNAGIGINLTGAAGTSAIWQIEDCVVNGGRTASPVSGNGITANFSSVTSNHIITIINSIINGGSGTQVANGGDALNFSFVAEGSCRSSLINGGASGTVGSVATSGRGIAFTSVNNFNIVESEIYGGSGLIGANSIDLISTTNSTIESSVIFGGNSTAVNGAGGIGVSFGTGSNTNLIRNCEVIGANGTVGNAAGGSGITFANSATVSRNRIQYCSIAGGNGIGTGTGGDGVTIGAAAQATEVSNSIIMRTGTPIATAGIAIRDNNPTLNTNGATPGSSIFANYAYNIANLVTRYIIHNGTVSVTQNPFPNGIDATADATAFTRNALYANYYVQ